MAEEHREPDSTEHSGPPVARAADDREPDPADGGVTASTDEDGSGPASHAEQAERPDPGDEDAPPDGGATQRKTRRKRVDKPFRDDQPTVIQFAHSVFDFYGEANADLIGVATREPEKEIRRATGRLDEVEVTAITTRYAWPDCFDEAVGLLRRDQVLVVEGPPGTGRRSGAVNLLRKVTRGPVVVLSPLVTLRELAEREYRAGYGYLVVDRGPDSDRGDLDFTWAMVRDQVCQGPAHLVVTSTAVAVRAANRAVRHVTWECPPPAVVLRAQLLGRGCRTEEVDAVVAQLVAGLPDACPLARVIDLAELVGGGEDPAEALRRLAGNAGREVKNWFAEEHDRREILEVAALGFLEGTDVRSFETLLGRLQRSTAERLAISAKRARVLWRDDSLFGDRGTRADGDGLIGIGEAGSRSGPTKVMVFRDEAYGRFVLEELWRTRSVAFWDAIREWLDGIAAGGVSVRVARGLAHLACTDFDEVVGSYLDPWSWGRVGWSGQVTATYVLWYMCHLRGLAPAALHTAVRWANGRDVDRRMTALLAFAGNLGVCYPTDAANRLWQLTTQSDDLRGAGCTALGCLFATLVDEAPDDARVVLNLLDRKMESLGDGTGRGRMRAGDLARLRGITMTAALAVVSTNSVRTQRSALFEHVHAHPDRLGLVARVCTGLFRYRPLRRQALIEFRRGLHALRDLSDDPPAEARALGAALAAATQPHEREALRTEFARLDEQLRRGKQESVADVLLAYLEAISGPTDTGGET